MVVPVFNPPKVKMDKQEYIGNCKEIRIETNKNHLRIIGNGNKVRLINNSGHLEIIGNTTRVKVIDNCGKITYTGNNGKVYLGKDSSVTNVNYFGNNGILKLVSNAELHGTTKEGSDLLCDECKTKSLNQSTSTITTTTNIRSQRSSKSPPLSAAACDGQQLKFDFASFNEKKSNSAGFQKAKIHSRIQNKNLYVKNNISMPNLDAIGYGGGGTQITNSIKIASSTGNIVVSNNIKF